MHSQQLVYHAKNLHNYIVHIYHVASTKEYNEN